MRFVRITAACLIAWPMLLAGQVATLAYEGFDYLKGGCLADGATGTGWSGSWGAAGEGGNPQSEWIIGPGSFSLPSSYSPTSGQHVDLNQVTGDRRITRGLGQTLGTGSPLVENVFSFVLDFGNGLGVDFAGIELSHSSGGPVIFIGKPPGSGPSNAGNIGMDIYGQGFTGTGIGGSGQRLLTLRWIRNANGPETLDLIVCDPVTGAILGTASQTAEVSFNRVTLLARRDLGAGGSIPAFDEIRATAGPIQMRTLGVASVEPSSGVPITITPADLNGSGTGDSELQRVYAVGASVTLTAPAGIGANTFRKWTLNGADYSTRRTITVTMTENRALAAVYLVPPPPFSLAISIVGTSDPVEISASPADQNGEGGGIAPFSRIHAPGSTVTLTAPELAGLVFRLWRRDGADYQLTRSITVSADADHAFSAVYDYPMDEKISGIAVEANGFQAAWSGVGGRSYVLQASSDLIEPFHDVSGVLVAPGTGRTNCVLTESLPTRPPSRFYRIKTIAP